jgi:DNA-directed RNA polymerase subunit N (RpoN/RPB10)
MIIPVRCFTCGKVLADKWEYYKKKREEKKLEHQNKVENQTKTEETLAFTEQWGYSDILIELGLDRMCCRRHMLGHVDLIDII